MNVIRDISLKLIALPNIPFEFMLAMYIGLRIRQETGVESHLFDDANIDTPEIREFIDRVYPRGLHIFIAAIFYWWVMTEVYKLIN